MKKKARSRGEERGKGADAHVAAPAFNLSPEARRWIVIVALVTASIIALLSLVGMAGSAGMAINKLLGFLFGNTKILAPVLLAGVTYLVIKQDRHSVTPLHMLGLVLLILTFNGLWHVRYGEEEAWLMVLSGQGGGLVGFFLGYSLRSVLGFWAATLVLGIR